ncbi:zinc finger and BTB domain-containing protein 14-like isoform 3-T3 [Pholidichthys leucotaenia]
MAETVKYVDDDHKSIFLKLLNEQRLEGEHCDIAVVVEDVKFRAHRCVLAACSNYFKKLFKKHEVDNSSVIEIDFIRSDIFEEVLNYMYTAKISVKKRDVNLMMSSGQILGIRFLDKLCSQKRDVSSEEKDKFPYDIVKMALPPEAQLAADAEELGENEDPPTADDLVEASPNQELDKSPSAALHVQEAILKELTNEDVHKVTCYDQDVVTEMEGEPKEMGVEHHASQTLTFTDSMGGVKDEQPPGWTTATADMKFEYLLYGHREQLTCQVCGKNFLDESRLRLLAPCRCVSGTVRALLPHIHFSLASSLDLVRHHQLIPLTLLVHLFPAGALLVRPQNPRNTRSSIQLSVHSPVRSAPKLSPPMLT